MLKEGVMKIPAWALRLQSCMDCRSLCHLDWRRPTRTRTQACSERGVPHAQIIRGPQALSLYSPGGKLRLPRTHGGAPCSNSHSTSTGGYMFEIIILRFPLVLTSSLNSIIFPWTLMPRRTTAHNNPNQTHVLVSPSVEYTNPNILAAW